MVKVLDSGTPEQTLRRATRELQAFASVPSPHLVSLYDAGQDGHRLFYSMEYLPLGSLANPRVALDEGRIVRAVACAARAADALHDHGIAHRDIQPINILLTDEGGKLADLGFAQVFEPDYKVTGVGNIGAVEFMDPALVQGATATRSSDIWSLGATLHRAAAGVGLYGTSDGIDPLLMIRKVISSGPELAAGLSSELRRIIERCTHTSAAERYRTAGELAEDLERL